MDQTTPRARPIGRTLRLLVGIALVIEAGRHLWGDPLSVAGMTLGVVAVELLFYVGVHMAVSRFWPRINAWVGAVIAVAPVAAVFFLSDAPGRLGTLLFIGISLVLTAVRSDGGCEVMTIPGMILGRRTHLVCIGFSPIDWVERRFSSRRHENAAAAPGHDD